MIAFNRFVLENGLRVLVHEDDSTPMAAVNVLYDVGSRDEDPEKTGFAHLFEHLMFGGSKNIPDFDEPIQVAGGENNAFTNSDITNFYDTLPASNIETAFWLESDRMLSLNFDPKVLEVQQKVVIEEFKETCINQPYGDVWHHLAPLSYKNHPYQWPTIGKVPKHVEDATMDDVKDFYYKYYRPNNAIITIAGNVKTEDMKVLCEKWFGRIPTGQVPERNLPQEQASSTYQYLEKEANVPVDAIYMAFNMCGRADTEYYACDLLTDILCNGNSSRLYRKLLKEEQLFSSIDCYVTGYLDPGLLMIEAKPAEGISIEKARAAIWKEIELIKSEIVEPSELDKVKNKVESALIFSEASILNKAINLAFFELLGDANKINDEVHYYEKVTSTDIHTIANKVLQKDNCVELIYKAKPSDESEIKD